MMISMMMMSMIMMMATIMMKVLNIKMMLLIKTVRMMMSYDYGDDDVVDS